MLEIIWITFCGVIIILSLYSIWGNYIASKQRLDVLAHIAENFPIEEQMRHLLAVQAVSYFKHHRYVLMRKDYKTLYPTVYPDA